MLKNFTSLKLLFFIMTYCSFTCMAQINWTINPAGAVFARQGDETPEGTFRFTSSGYEVFTIMAADKFFQPASLYYGDNNVDKDKIDRMAPDGKVPTSMNCFLINTPEGYIMIDTGLPASKGGKTLERLASLNISPASIKAVYLTHSHFDHIGGLLDDKGNAVFIAAIVYISSAEMEFMKESMKDATKQLTAAYANRLVTFDFGDVLPCNIMPVAAIGHTPGHTAFQLGNLLFVGDLMHGASIQLIDPSICAAYDADRSRSVISRNRLLSYAVANSLTVLGAHVPLNGILF